jgi:hypothetical protein
MPEDVVRYDGREVAALAEAAWAFLAERKPGAPKIRLESPTAAGEHLRSISVLEVINDDMPFLVDSVLGELADRGIEVLLVAHPVMSVTRDAAWRVKSFAENGNGNGNGNGDGSLQNVTGYLEKPSSEHAVSMGVYALSPRLLPRIRPGAVLDFPDLVLKALAAGERVASYRYDGLWLDIGRHEDYEQAISAEPDLATVLKDAAERNQLAAAGEL